MKTAVWFCLPVFLATLAYFVTQASWNSKPATAVLDCPPEVDLGEREFGEIAVGRFVISNRGNGPLVIAGISTSCSCAGMEREIDGKFHHVDKLEIPPEKKEELIVRVAVKSDRVGSAMTTLIGFQTNDPHRPTAQIKVKVPRA